jgi:hypothetical protein
MTEEQKVITIDGQEVAPIPNVDAGYYISRNGDVFSSKKSRGAKVDGYYLLSCTVHSNGYRYATLMDDGKSKKFSVQRLVASAFIENQERKRCVNHINGDKLNNQVSNLEWATHSENANHAFQTGLRKGVANLSAITASAKARSTITKQQAVQIASYLETHPKTTYAAIGKLFGCSANTVHRVVTGKHKYFKEVA